MNNNWTSIASGDYTHYALTDHQFSVVALIDNVGKLIERVAYTAYGEARHRPAMDINGDGAVSTTDAGLSTAAHGKLIYQSGYNPDADLDRDGEVDATGDDIIMVKDWVAAVPTGRISRTHMAAGADNTIGYCGYAFNAEVDCVGLYTVRFRHYDPQFGRWLSRDPAGYMDSMSLYGYGWGGPMGFTDSMGLYGGRQDRHGGIWQDREMRRNYLDPVFGPRAEYARQIREDLLEPAYEYGTKAIEIAVIILSGRVLQVVVVRVVGTAISYAYRYGPAAYRAIIEAGTAGYSAVDRFIGFSTAIGYVTHQTVARFMNGPVRTVGLHMLIDLLRIKQHVGEAGVVALLIAIWAAGFTSGYYGNSSEPSDGISPPEFDHLLYQLGYYSGVACRRSWRIKKRHLAGLGSRACRLAGAQKCGRVIPA